MNLKKLSFFVLFNVAFTVPTIVLAQKSKETNTVATTTSTTTPAQTTDGYALKETIFRSALKYGDLIVAKQALYEMIALKPADKSLKDSLAYVYINLGSMREAILLTREILENDPSNTNILEVRAIAEQSLGMAKESLTSYETLYGKTKNVYHLYQIATLQYELKRLAECNSSVDQILTSSEVDKKEIQVGTGARGQQQKVTLKAAALNVKGVLAMDLNENTIAKTCFEEALKQTPDFVLAKNNLDFLTKKNQTPAKTVTKPATKK